MGSIANDKAPSALPYDHCIEAKEKQQTALKQLEYLARVLRSDSTSGEGSGIYQKEAEEVLASVQNNIGTQPLDQLLRAISSCDRKGPNAVTPAHNVIEIPELLEHTLYLLDLQCILCAMQVNKQFCQSILSSRKSQREFGFLDDPDTSKR